MPNNPPNKSEIIAATKLTIKLLPTPTINTLAMSLPAPSVPKK